MKPSQRALLWVATSSVSLLIVVGLGDGGLAVIGDTKADQRLAPEEVSLTGVADRLNFDQDRGRFALYVALAEEAQGAAITLVSETDPVDAGRLLRVGRGRSVRIASEEVREPLARAVRSVVEERAFVGREARAGSVRHAGEWWEWELHLLDRDPQELVIHSPWAGFLIVVDGRLLPPDVRTHAPSTGLSVSAASMLFTPVGAGFVEAGLLFIILLVGGLVLPRDAVIQPMRVPLALISGLAAVGVAGAFTSGVLIIVMSAFVILAIRLGLARAGNDPGWRLADRNALLAAACALPAVAVGVRSFGLVHVSTDSVGYLDTASSLAGAGPALRIPSGEPSSFIAVHALGSLSGVDAIFSLGPALMAAGVALLIGAALREPRRGSTLVMGLLAILVLAGSSFVRLLTMLVNSHAYVAVLLLALGVLWSRGLTSSLRQDGLVPVAGILAAAVTLGRPEGAVVIVLFLAGTLFARLRGGWNGVWYWVGAVTLIRPAFDLLVGSGSTTSGDLVLLMIGLGALLVPVAVGRLPGDAIQALPRLLVVLLWIALVVFSNRGRMPRLIANTRENLFTGASGWGLVVPGLLILLVLAVALSTVRSSAASIASLGPLVTLAIGFVPAMLLVRAFGSDSSGRVHWHDSNNRMWLHLLPVLLLLIIELSRSWSAARPEGGQPALGCARRPYAAVVVVVLALPALAWQPVFERELPRRAELLAEQPESLWKGDGLGGEAGSIGPILVGLQTVLASVPLDRDALSAVDSSRPGEVCVGVRLGTFGRPVSGGVEIEVASGRLASAGVVEVQDLEDLERAIVCLDLGEEQGGIGLLGDDALVTIRGRGTLEGAAPAVMLDEAGAPVLSADLSWFDAPRRDEPFVRMVPRIALLGVAFLALLTLLLPLRLGRGALERT